MVSKPFEVCHTASELGRLADFLKSLDGEVRVVMEYTGRYYEPVAHYLYEAGVFVTAVHAKLIHDFGNNSIRKVKTDKADSLKIANYGLTHWTSLKRYTPEDDTRLLLKTCNRQYNQCMKLRIALKNNLIALLDQTFPGVNTLFATSQRQDGREKWVDFAGKFWHCECVSSLSTKAFAIRYNKWCGGSGYQGSDAKAAMIHVLACAQIPTLPKNESTMKLGAGNVLGPQLIAEIGDVRRFTRKQSLVAFAGVDAPPYQSGSFESKDRKISKRGSTLLRKTLFQIMVCILQTAPEGDPVFQFLDRKRAEGKRYYVYMVAGSNKFLRIYYGRVKEYLAQQDLQA